MKAFEKELKKIINEIDKQKIYPVEKTIANRTTSDVYHLLLVRGLIEKRPFMENPDRNTFEIHVTPKGYAYFLEKRYLCQSLIINIVISVISGALSGIIAALLIS